MSDSDTVSIRSALFRDPRYWDLKPTQRAGLPVLIDLMQQYGQDGVLDLSRKAICRETGIRPGMYADLLFWMDKWGWGCETDEGRLVLCGILATPPSLTALPGVDLQQMIAQAVAAAIATAIPAAIRANEAAQQREYRAGKKQKGTADVGDKSAAGAENVDDIPGENGSDVVDNEVPSRIRAESIDSNRVDIDSNKSYSSIDSNDSIRSIEKGAVATVPPELLPADVVQMLIEKSPNPDGTGKIESPRAQTLLDAHGAERCLQVLLLLALRKSPTPGRFIEAALANKGGKFPIPADLVKEAKRRLSPSAPKRPPRAAQATSVQEAPPSEEDRIAARIWSFAQTMTPAEETQIQAEAIDRMIEPFRSQYRTAIADKLAPPHQARAEFNAARLLVVREWALRDSDSPNAWQGGGS